MIESDEYQAAAGPGDEEAPDSEDGDDGDQADESAAGPRRKAALSPNLTGKQRRFLRARAHHLQPVLQIGHEGISPAVVKQALVQLQAHELIKVKVGEGAPAGRHGTAEELAAATKSDLAQVLGRTFLLFKKRAKDSKINLPK
jgi:RNA-binding protein